jgi:hypothetical protein
MEKIIPDYPTYAITASGFVRDLRSGRLMKGYCNHGYRQIGLLNYDGQKFFSIHRLVALAFIENPNNYPEVDHINRKPHDNRIENLRWVDDCMQAQNRGDNSNNTTGHKNIGQEDGYFRVVITKNKKIIARKRFQTLEKAIEYRDSILNPQKPTE